MANDLTALSKNAIRTRFSLITCFSTTFCSFRGQTDEKNAWQNKEEKNQFDFYLIVFSPFILTNHKIMAISFATLQFHKTKRKKKRNNFSANINLFSEIVDNQFRPRFTNAPKKLKKQKQMSKIEEKPLGTSFIIRPIKQIDRLSALA